MATRPNLLRRLKWSIETKAHRMWHRFVFHHPRFKNEGEATAQVVDMAFGGYPMGANFASKEDAVQLLQSIWDIVDNWDGSRVNVAWARGDKKGLPVYDWARGATDE